MKSDTLFLAIALTSALISAPLFAETYQAPERNDAPEVAKKERIPLGIQPLGDRVEDGGGSQTSSEPAPSSDYNIPDSDSGSYE